MRDETEARVSEEAGAAKASAEPITEPVKVPRVEKPVVEKAVGGKKSAPKENKPLVAKDEAGLSTSGKAASPKVNKPGVGKGGEKPAKKAAASKTEAAVPRLKALYKETIAPALFKERGYKSVMQVPKVVKVVVSMGIGEATSNKKLLDAAVTDVSAITGQHAVKTKAKKSIANFKLREGNEVGVMVTLRGTKMYEFLDRLINVALPRVKDFRGVKASGFDGHGNYSLGITEQIIFPEIDFDKIERIAGLNVNIVTTASTDADARLLLDKFRMPFRK